MAKMKAIDIDLDVLKKIEHERQDVDETPNDILRRLLVISEPQTDELSRLTETKNEYAPQYNQSFPSGTSEAPSVQPNSLSSSLEGKANTPSEDYPGWSWSGKGITLPHNTQLRMTYKGVEITGHIDRRKWIIKGCEATPFRSPSKAAMEAVKTYLGKPLKSLNGWLYWECQRPGDDKWKNLKDIDGYDKEKWKRNSTRKTNENQSFSVSNPGQTHRRTDPYYPLTDPNPGRSWEE